jgi:hypothetical protein
MAGPIEPVNLLRDAAQGIGERFHGKAMFR